MRFATLRNARGGGRHDEVELLRRPAARHALVRAPLTALDVSLLTGTLSEEAVGELLSGERRPDISELTAICEALELPVDALLANQRVAGGDRDE